VCGASVSGTEWDKWLYVGLSGTSGSMWD
jgi:hypothetical protein